MNQRGGNDDYVQPYIRKKKKELEQNVEKLEYVQIYKNICDKIEKSSIDDKEKSFFIYNFYKEIKEMTNSIIENFLKLNPVLFIGVEFPRTLHYKDRVDPNVMFEKASSLPKPDGYIRIQNKELHNKVNDSIKLKIPGNDKKNKCICFNANHRSYFGNNPKTLDIVDDPIIGIDTLIKQINDTDTTINNVMGLKFALGTSGTGKTFRLFGDSKTNSPGIITKVYEKAKGDKKVSYLLFYGRRKKQDDEGNPNTKEFKEYLFNFKNFGGMVAENGNGGCKISCYKQENFSEDLNPNNFENFYDKLMSRKITKIAEVTVTIGNKNVTGNTGHDILKFLRGEIDKISNTLAGDSKIFSDFNELCKSDDIYEQVGEDQLVNYFEGNLSRQRKLYSVLPTMNNIESSRGHTLVLLKLKIGNHDRYYPLVDMAGTENPKDMQRFNDKFAQESKLDFVKTIQKLNFDKDYHQKQDKSGKFNSLKEVKNEPTNFKQGGTSIQYSIDDKQLKEKIINEGYYINHTIASLVLTIMFISNLIKLPKKNRGDNLNKYKTYLEGDKIYNNTHTCDIMEGGPISTGDSNPELNSTYESIKATLNDNYFNHAEVLATPGQKGGNRNNENIFNFNDFLKQTINGQYGGSGSGSVIKEQCGEKISHFKDSGLVDPSKSQTKFLGNFNSPPTQKLYESLLKNGSLWMQFIFSFLFWNSLTDSAAINKLENIIDTGIDASTGLCVASDYNEISEIKEIFNKNSPGSKLNIKHISKPLPITENSQIRTLITDGNILTTFDNNTYNNIKIKIEPQSLTMYKLPIMDNERIVYQCFPKNPKLNGDFEFLDKQVGFNALNGVFNQLKMNYKNRSYFMFNNLFGGTERNRGLFNTPNYATYGIFIGSQDGKKISCIHNLFNSVIKIFYNNQQLDEEDFKNLQYIECLILNKFMNELSKDIAKQATDRGEEDKAVILNEIKTKILDKINTVKLTNITINRQREKITGEYFFGRHMGKVNSDDYDLYELNKRNESSTTKVFMHPTDIIKNYATTTQEQPTSRVDGGTIIFNNKYYPLLKSRKVDNKYFFYPTEKIDVLKNIFYKDEINKISRNIDKLSKLIPIFFAQYTELINMGEQYKIPGITSFDTSFFNKYFTQVSKGFPRYFQLYDENNQVRALYDIFMFVIAYFEKLKIDWINKYNNKYESEEQSNQQFKKIYDIINSLKNSSTTDSSNISKKNKLLCFLYVLMGFKKVEKLLENDTKKLNPENEELVTNSPEIKPDYITFLNKHVFQGIDISPPGLVPDDGTDDELVETQGDGTEVISREIAYNKFKIDGGDSRIQLNNKKINKLIELNTIVQIKDKINIKSLLTILKINNYFNKTGFVNDANLEVTQPGSTKYKNNLKRFSDGDINVAQIRILRLFTGQDIPNKYEGELEVAKLAEEIFESSYILDERNKPCNQYKN